MARRSVRSGIWRSYARARPRRLRRNQQAVELAGPDREGAGMSNRTRMRQARALRVAAREWARHTLRRLTRQARIAWLISLFGALLSACGGGAASGQPTPASAAHASPSASVTYTA